MLVEGVFFVDLKLSQNPLLPTTSIELYANAVSRKGAPLDNCFGFVDGTVRPISRPQRNQRIVYNGHKRVHAIKFQSVVTPNGMIANMFGPVGEYANQQINKQTNKMAG